jgi:hypothetical protein
MSISNRRPFFLKNIIGYGFWLKPARVIYIAVLRIYLYGIGVARFAAVALRYGDQRIVDGIGGVARFIGRVINRHHQIHNAFVVAAIGRKIDVLAIKIKVTVPFHHLEKLVAVVSQAIGIKAGCRGLHASIGLLCGGKALLR